MRCPKCGYISFDHAESCSKCKKDISAISEQLSGTILLAEAPAFLQFNLTDSEMDADRGIDISPEEAGFATDATVDIDGSETANEIEFDFMEDNSDEAGSAEVDEEDFDLPLEDDETIEIVMDEAEEVDLQIDDAPQVDFNGLDISDLAPPDAGTSTAAGELSLEGLGSGSPSSGTSAAAPMGLSGEGLEDLSMDGLDLETPSLPPAGSVTGENFRPAVKTGTALDNFDFDLGELVGGEEK